jgi:hypothetical protein
VAWPLQVALRQLTGEARTRDVVESELAVLVPKGHLVSEQTEVGTSSVAIHVVATTNISADAVHEAESKISKQSGRLASITVEGIASQSELAKLMERVRDQPAAAPVKAPPPPPPPPSLDVQGAKLVKRVGPALADLWPKETPITDFAIVFGQTQTTVQVHYQARRALDPISIGLLTQALQSRLATPELQLDSMRVPITRVSTRRR